MDEMQKYVEHAEKAVSKVNSTLLIFALNIMSTS